jgi:hypothetical protein
MVLSKYSLISCHEICLTYSKLLCNKISCLSILYCHRAVCNSFLNKALIPSRSSMDFSSLATVLSANSARVSAWGTQRKWEGVRTRRHLWHGANWFTTVWIKNQMPAVPYLLQLVTKNLDLLLILVLFFWVLSKYKSVTDKLWTLEHDWTPKTDADILAWKCTENDGLAGLCVNHA